MIVKFKHYYNWKKYLKIILSITLVISVVNIFSGAFSWYAFLIIPALGLGVFGEMYLQYKLYEKKNQTIKDIRKIKLNKLKFK